MSFIQSIGTAIPSHTYSTDAICKWMKQMLPDELSYRKLEYVFKESLIEKKHSVLPDFDTECQEPLLFKHLSPFVNPTTSERLAVYKSSAAKLGVQAAENCIKSAAINKDKITHIITVTCTGLIAPGLEIQIADDLGLSMYIDRSAVNFMGCYAAFHALKMADMICKVAEHHTVLIVCVELCTLHFRNMTDNDNILSTVLFSDGAAAALVSSTANKNSTSIELKEFQSALIPDGKDDMQWNIGQVGFEMKLNQHVPTHIRNKLKAAYDRLLNNHTASSGIDYYAIHPGGKKILEAFCDALSVNIEAIPESYEVLKNYGNMSSGTILFVLNEILNSFTLDPKKEANVYAAAFGPGLTVESGYLTLKKAIV